MVRFDNEAVEVQQSSHAIRRVEATVALSPGARAIVRTAAADDDEGDDDDSKSGASTSDGESENGSEEESPGQNIHAERRKKYQEDYAKLVGSKITVCAPLKHHFCVCDYVPLQQQAVNAGVTTTWTIVNSTKEEDLFPELEGPFGVEDPTVIQACDGVDYLGAPGDKLKLLLHLWPGDYDHGFNQVRDAQKNFFPRAKALQKREWMVFKGLVIGAVQFLQRGQALWRKDDYVGLRGHPNYSQHMSEGRFDQIKKVANYCFADLSRRSSDPWWPIRGGVDGFNQNRQRTIKKSRAICIDESMSAFQPRASKLGGLPHLSFIKRKPRPLGTEFKCAADGPSGVMLWLEIQEGKAAMKGKALVGTLGANAACAMRIAMAVICANGF
jgi:hypothetical protein